MPDQPDTMHNVTGRAHGRGAMHAFIVSAVAFVSSIFLAFVLSGTTAAASGTLEGANLFAFVALCSFWVAFWSGTVWLIATAGPRSPISRSNNPHDYLRCR
jgi:hypothetical protein